MSDKMRIGELAAHFSLNPKTIRYYETIGLLPKAGRNGAGYRTYDEQDRLRLSFIRRAKRLSFSLNDIRALLRLQQAGSPPCEQVLDLLEQKLHLLDQQIAELQAFRAILASLQADWTTQEGDSHVTTSPASICPLIEQQEEDPLLSSGKNIGGGKGGELVPRSYEFLSSSHR